MIGVAPAGFAGFFYLAYLATLGSPMNALFFGVDVDPACSVLFFNIKRSMSIKQLPTNERPRERLIRYGSESLSTIELLAILLGSGTQNRSVLELAKDLLTHFKSVTALSEASIEEMKLVKGIGSAKAVALKAAFGLLNRLELKEKGMLLDEPQKVYDLISSDLAGQKVEMLMVVLRDVRRFCLHREIVSKGTLTELLMHPREIFHLAIRHRAHSLIIAHNHPSGDPAPSTRDIEMTKLLVSAGRVVGIDVSDHLIIGERKYVSLARQGWIDMNNRLY